MEEGGGGGSARGVRVRIIRSLITQEKENPSASTRDTQQVQHSDARKRKGGRGMGPIHVLVRVCGTSFENFQNTLF